MTTPNIPLEQVPSNTLSPGVVVNDAFQVIDALTRPGGIVQSRTLTAPPATTGADIGKRWIIAANPTGAWLNQAGKIALCVAANVWRFFAPSQGWRAYCLAESADVEYTGSVWASKAVDIDPGSITKDLLAASVFDVAFNTQTGSSYTLDVADANNVVLMDSAEANSIVVPTHADKPIRIGSSIEVWCIGDGPTTIAPASGVVIKKLSGLTYTLAGKDAGVALRKQSENVWRLIGQLAAEETP